MNTTDRNIRQQEMIKLIQFAEDSKEINPNLLNDVMSGLINPSKVLDEAMVSFYGDEVRKIRSGVKNSFR